MKLSENINKIEFSLLECQADIVLHALELYAYNLHFTFSRDEDYEILNTMLFHTYEGILARYSSNSYKIGYDVEHKCLQEAQAVKKRNYCQVKAMYLKSA